MAAQAENWPGWRGPRGDGTSVEEHVPSRWDGTSGENVAWRTAIPGLGHASPVIWEDRVFVVSCLVDEASVANPQEAEPVPRVLVCLDRRSGDVLWQRTVLKSKLETRHQLNSHASSTPVTDGRLIYVTFLEIDGTTVPAPNVGRSRPITPGTIVVAAYDFEGNQKWIVRPGQFVSAHGFCSSPILYENLVIVNGDHDGQSYIVALDRTTGETAWKSPRPHGIRSYVTPLIREVSGRTQMVFSGSKSIVSLNPRDGSPHWMIDGPTEQFVASMVFDGEKFYMAAGFPTYHVMAIRADGQGNVTDTHVSWHSTDAKCYVPSPVLVGNRLFVADDRGTANCFDTDTGNRLWQGRLGANIDTSLVTAGGLVYFLGRDGIMRVVKPADEMQIVAENPVGEDCFASPAISHNQLFIRGEQHLFCIAAKE